MLADPDGPDGLSKQKQLSEGAPSWAPSRVGLLLALCAFVVGGFLATRDSGDGEPRGRMLPSTTPTVGASPDPRDETEPEAGELSVYDLGLTATAGCVGDSLPAGGSSGLERVPAIAEDVEKLRGLAFDEEPKVEFMSARDLARYVERSSADELNTKETRAQLDALISLRLVPEDFSLERYVKDLAGQVLGLYEPRREELLVGDRGALGPADQMTVAHELDHALTDQVLGFPDLTPRARRADAQLAERAVIEGDASVLMQQYGLRHFGSRFAGLLDDATTAEQRRAVARTPHFLRRSLAFPYQEGQLFVCDVFSRGGWYAVDRLYDRMPRSTLEILFPRVRGEVRVRRPSVPPDPGAGWTKALTSTLGASELQWMFEAPGGVETLDPASAALRAGRWRGGGAHVWSRGREIVIALTLREGRDLSGRAPEPLCHHLIQWGAQSFPDAKFVDGRGADGAWRVDGDVTLVRCENHEIRYVVAPDFATAERVSRFE